MHDAASAVESHLVAAGLASRRHGEAHAFFNSSTSACVCLLLPPDERDRGLGLPSSGSSLAGYVGAVAGHQPLVLALWLHSLNSVISLGVRTGTVVDGLLSSSSPDNA